MANEEVHRQYRYAPTFLAIVFTLNLPLGNPQKTVVSPSGGPFSRGKLQMKFAVRKKSKKTAAWPRLFSCGRNQNWILVMLLEIWVPLMVYVIVAVEALVKLIVTVPTFVMLTGTALNGSLNAGPLYRFTGPV